MKEEQEKGLEAFGQDYPGRFRGFHDLMPHKVNEILLVASLYDSFILEEDGRLAERVFRHFVELHLSTPPRITRVSSGVEARERLATGSFDLVVTMLNLPDGETEAFIEGIKEERPGLPVVLLTWDRESLRRREKALYQAGLDRAFLWSGDSEIFLALIKSVEDRLNLAHDVSKGDVRLLVVVENSVRYYSSLLPLLYQAIMTRTRALMDQGLNDLDKLFRMRARTKLLHALDYEEAFAYVDAYRENLLGFISDISFNRRGREDPQAGFRLLAQVRERLPDLPFLLLSSEGANRARARRVGAAFLDKNSPHLLVQVEQFLQANLGFGPFVFRHPDQSVIDRADTLDELAEKLEQVPDGVIEHHSRANHFSHWLAARGEFVLADALRPRSVEDFADIGEVRRYLVEQIRGARRRELRGVITDMKGYTLDPAFSFVRIGTGSLGGKSRGIAFLEALLEKGGLADEFPQIDIRIPPTIALGSFLFRRFVTENGLDRFATTATDDTEVAAAFTASRLPPEVVKKLQAVLRRVREPLAVRSSSLQEDSPDQPFAGVFTTCMVPNNHPEIEVRLEQLCRAVKLVYASTWYRSAIRYLHATGNEPGEEKMGVAIQSLVGARHGRWFYPWISGVAKTHDFYPFRYIEAEDGAAEVALGLGKTVVSGGNALRFCPAHPQVVPQLSDLDRILENTQKDFWALDLECREWQAKPEGEGPLVRLSLDQAERDGTLQELVSVLSAQDNRLRDGLRGEGPRILTFAPILKWEIFPLAPLLVTLLDRIRRAMAGPAEIEFAAMPGDGKKGIPPSFSLLQVRPIPEAEMEGGFLPAEYEEKEVLVASDRALGQGKLDHLRDILYVDRRAFDRLRTREIVPEIEEVNDRLARAGRKYLLIGPGRWGTADPPLGIPVTWDQVSGAGALVEADLPGYEIDPSQGSHFFHNLTSFRVLFLAVGLRNGGERLDWEWLESRRPHWRGTHTRHVRLEEPLRIAVDGRTGKGLVLKP